jgi:hypothetical protein
MSGENRCAEIPETESCRIEDFSLEDRAIGTVPEDALPETMKTESNSTIALESPESLEAPRRLPLRSRRVPNLLTGPALLPSPVTPNFSPASPPILGEWNGRIHSIAIFPQFMIAPNLTVGDSAEKITFVKEAMEKAVGLPPIVFDSGNCHLETQKDRKYHQRRERYKKESNRAQRSYEKVNLPPFKSIETDFPALDGPSKPEVDISTPSPHRKKWVKFPTKNSQIKKMSLASM